MALKQDTILLHIMGFVISALLNAIGNIVTMFLIHGTALGVVLGFCIGTVCYVLLQICGAIYIARKKRNSRPKEATQDEIAMMQEL